MKIDGLILVILSIIPSLQASFATDEAHKYCSPATLFWMSVALAALAAGLGALKGFRSTQFADAKAALATAVKVSVVVLVCLFAVGCMASRNDIVAVKSTVLGLDISSDASAATPHVRLGLVRNYYQRIPTATNTVYAPPYASHVDAQIGLAKQNAVEDFWTK